MHHMFVFFLFSSITSVSTVVLLIILLLKGSVGKEYAYHAGGARDTDLIPGLGRSLGVGNGNQRQFSCLEKFMDKEAWQATIHGVAEHQM